MFFVSLVLLLCSCTQVVLSESLSSERRSISPVRGFPSRGRHSRSSSELIEQTAASSPTTAHVFRQKISHFPADSRYAPHVDGTFRQRYWTDTSFYQPGGPVFLLDSGEAEGTMRIPFLQHGILRLLTETFHGVGVILEMRYYGTSFPTKDLSTDSLRFLDTKQSLADAAYFAQNIVFPGLESHNLTAPKTPWIYYGGSYAGAKAAYMKVTYPDLIWGAIGSSAIVKAVVSYSDYYRTIEKTGDPECIKGLQTVTATVDSIIGSGDVKAIAKMKADFGVAGLSHIDDFVSLLGWLPANYQEQNWDPSANPQSQTWSKGCAVLKGAGGAKLSSSPYPVVYHTYAEMTTQYVSQKSVCPTPGNAESCFGSYDLPIVQASDLSQVWRTYFYQTCTEEGYFQHHPPGTDPSVVSRYLTLDYSLRQCRQAFPPGNYNRLPPLPEVSIPNSYGGYNISADRLAFISGLMDPWLYVTPHSPLAPPRESTLLRPFYLIQHGVHHYDENGLPGGLSNPKLPKEVRDVQRFELEFVSSWLDDFKKLGGGLSKLKTA